MKNKLNKILLSEGGLNPGPKDYKKTTLPLDHGAFDTKLTTFLIFEFLASKTMEAA